MKKKYAYANIKIPVELKENGTLEPLKEYVQIEFSACNELPKQNVNNLSAMNGLTSLFTTLTNVKNDSSNKISTHSNDNKLEINSITEGFNINGNEQPTQDILEPPYHENENIPREVTASLIKQYKKREGLLDGTVGSAESFKNKKRNKFNITAKMR